MRASPAALPALEIAVGRRGAALAGAEHVSIHAEAHRAAGVAPFETGFAKHAIQSLALRLRLHALRSRHDHRADARRDVPAAHDASRRAQIFDPRVGARSQKDPVDGDALECRPRLETHVLERAARGLTLVFGGELSRIG